MQDIHVALMVNILMGIIDVINTQWVYIATYNMSTNIYRVRDINEYVE